MISGITPLPLSRRQVAAQFRGLIDSGIPFLPAGTAKRDPSLLLAAPYVPKHAVTLLNVTYYLTDFYHIEDLNFFVAYVFTHGRTAYTLRKAVYPRIFYKDSSLLWRVASHIIDTPQEQWIGKGDLRIEHHREGDFIASDESSTNLPYEIQSAFDEISRRTASRLAPHALGLILRNAPAGRMAPYADFSAPRVQAAQAANINNGRRVARLIRSGDPESLRFAKGFEPDFANGLIETGESRSNLYGGVVLKHRFLSVNRRVQYQLAEAGERLWINPPQALTPELTSYGVRALHIPADEEVFIPAFEYHFVDKDSDPPVLFSQIPDGYAGAPNEVDPARADASKWIEALPVIRAFRRENKGQHQAGP